MHRMIAGKYDRSVQSYFEGRGFERFDRIYGEGEGRRNRFQNIVRDGHAMTRDAILEWLKSDQGPEELSLCDAGCGIGTMSIPIAQAGARVHAVDFSHKMIEAARVHAQDLLEPGANLRFEAQNFLDLDGSYDTVVCVDVFSRYPIQRSLEMLRHLCSLAKSQLIISFTPKKKLDRVLLKIGNTYARRQHVPLLYTHREEVIFKALEASGFEIARQKMIATRFNIYFCQLVEARRRFENVEEAPRWAKSSVA